MVFESRQARQLAPRLPPRARPAPPGRNLDRGELGTLVLAQIRPCLPQRPQLDGKRGRLAWHLVADRFEIGY